MISTNALDPRVGLDGPHIDPLEFGLAAVAAAGIAGFLLADLVARWPATAVVTMTLIAVFLTLELALMAWVDSEFRWSYTGDRETSRVLWTFVAILALFVLPAYEPGSFLVFALEAITWLFCARWILAGLRIMRTPLLVRRDLIAAGALVAVFWGPVLALLLCTAMRL